MTRVPIWQYYSDNNHIITAWCTDVFHLKKGRNTKTFERNGKCRVESQWYKRFGCFTEIFGQSIWVFCTQIGKVSHWRSLQYIDFLNSCKMVKYVSFFSFSEFANFRMFFHPLPVDDHDSSLALICMSFHSLLGGAFIRQHRTLTSK